MQLIIEWISFLQYRKVWFRDKEILVRINTNQIRLFQHFKGFNAISFPNQLKIE